MSRARSWRSWWSLKRGRVYWEKAPKFIGIDWHANLFTVWVRMKPHEWCIDWRIRSYVPITDRFAVSQFFYRRLKSNDIVTYLIRRLKSHTERWCQKCKWNVGDHNLCVRTVVFFIVTASFELFAKSRSRTECFAKTLSFCANTA